jgi:hypothetical protein
MTLSSQLAVLRAFEEEKADALAELRRTLEAEFAHRLPATQAQLDELATARHHQEIKLQAALQQVELLKTMRVKEHASPKGVAGPTSPVSTQLPRLTFAPATPGLTTPARAPSPADDNLLLPDAGSSVEADARYADLHRAWLELQHKYDAAQADFNEHHKDRADNQRRLEASLEAAREAAAAARVEAAKATAELKYAQSRHDQLAGELKHYKQEIDENRNKISELRANAQAQQKAAQQVLNDLATEREAARRVALEVQRFVCFWFSPLFLVPVDFAHCY